MKLVRLDTSILTSCIVFIPLLLMGTPYLEAAGRALPIALICMSCFVLNDIRDEVPDRTNHPNRPIPSGAISPKIAVVIYFLLVAATLITIYVFVAENDYYIYLLCLIVFTNYNHFIDDFPQFKNIYVAVAGIIPVLILRPPEAVPTSVDVLAIAMMFYMFGRELLMDVRDLEGDGNTLAKILGASKAGTVGFACQLLGVSVLMYLANTTLHWWVIGFLYVLTLSASVLWKTKRNRLPLIHVMKVQAFLGLALLF